MEGKIRVRPIMHIGDNRKQIFIEQNRTSQEVLDQTKACWYSFWCIYHVDFKYWQRSTGCGDSAFYQHLDTSNPTFSNEDVIILEREYQRYKKGVKKAWWEKPSLIKEGGLLHNLAGAYTVQFHHSKILPAPYSYVKPLNSKNWSPVE